ncbi:hypothetical protein CVT26_007660 [Gymnopilus dilepis]|uniref:Uncharacterized protein n=1 Tax=Gymnopilus dilepis TaxID=231916 RepID=A0A409VZN7_9AGAR|nr:hypothetical protein CVT26_007660 [Gymnopilus dilepis]
MEHYLENPPDLLDRHSCLEGRRLRETGRTSSSRSRDVEHLMEFNCQFDFDKFTLVKRLAMASVVLQDWHGNDGTFGSWAEVGRVLRSAERYESSYVQGPSVSWYYGLNGENESLQRLGFQFILRADVNAVGTVGVPENFFRSHTHVGQSSSASVENGKTLSRPKFSFQQPSTPFFDTSDGSHFLLRLCDIMLSIELSTRIREEWRLFLDKKDSRQVDSSSTSPR